MKRLITIITVGLMLAGCEWLPLQTNDPYTGKSLNTQTGKSAMEFINAHPEHFSNLSEAIALCGLEELYALNVQKFTYLLLNNEALTASDISAALLNEAGLEKLRNILKFHIVYGEYHGYGTLGYDPVYVITLWESPSAYMTLCLAQSATTHTSQDALRAMDQCGTSIARNSVSSNLFLTNGVAHVFNRKLEYKQ